MFYKFLSEAMEKMPVKSEIWGSTNNLHTMEEVCKNSDFDPNNMSEIEHLEELCMILRYLTKVLEHHTGKLKIGLPLTISNEDLPSSE